MSVPDELGDTQRTTGVARGRLDPQPLEGPLAQQPAVGDAVQRHAAGQAEVLEAGLAVHGARHAHDDLLADHLDRAGQIHIPLSYLGLRDPRRAAEQAVERAVGHRQPGEVVEVLLIQPERAILLKVNQLFQDEIHVLGLAVRRETHHLVLAGVDLEPGVVGERRVEQPERVRPVELFV